MSQEVILIVESDILVRGPLAQYLRECGYRVIEATNIAEARSYLSDAGIAVDVVLADAEPSGGNGFDLMKWIRAQRPEVAVILAGSVDKAVKKAADLCNDGPSPAKPYDHADVLAQIRRLIAMRDRK